MHFLLFVPDCTAADLEVRLKVAGIAHLLGGHDVLPRVSGPGGLTGLMTGWLSPDNPRMNYDAGQQEWIPSVVKGDDGAARYWIGIWKDKPPRSNELRRHYTQSGDLIELGGQQWKLPTPSTVDSRAVYADDGTMRWEVVRQFAWVCDEADELRQTYLQPSEFGVRQMVFLAEPSAQINWLLKLLSINYRITPEVAVHLDLWVGKDRLMDIFLATLGLSRKGGSDG